MNIDDLIDDGKYDLHWQMTRCERLIMVQILKSLTPSLAIEIGTHKGGSLQVIADYSDRVLSLDLDAELKNTLGSRFPNVEFISGDSRETLPAIIDDLNTKQQSPEFVLVDGDHSETGVRSDVNLILQIQPRQPMVILMHDSFNPNCRRGMLTAAWEACPFVQSVDIDFIPGLYAASSYDTAEAGSMWSGLGCAILTPQRRQGEVAVRQSQEKVFEAVERISVHRREPPLTSSPSLLPTWLNSLLPNKKLQAGD